MAHDEDVSDRYIGRMIKLAYLAPAVLEKLLLQRCPSYSRKLVMA
jgi:hypothetical protein